MSDQAEVTTKELLSRMDKGWNDLQAYLKTLTDAQLTTPTDPAGWTAKDHLAHLAVWEDGVNGLLEGRPQRELMGLEQAVWENRDYDKMNAVIQQRHKNMSLADVRRWLAQVHEKLVAKIQSIQDEDLLRPYQSYDPSSKSDKPVIGSIVGNTFEHYNEHMPWIAAIVEQTKPL